MYQHQQPPHMNAYNVGSGGRMSRGGAWQGVITSHRSVGNEVEFLVQRSNPMGDCVSWERPELLPLQQPLQYFVKRLEEATVDETVGRHIQENRKLRIELERVSRQWYRAQTRCDMLEGAVNVLQTELKQLRAHPGGDQSGANSNAANDFGWRMQGRKRSVSAGNNTPSSSSDGYQNNKHRRVMPTHKPSSYPHPYVNEQGHQAVGMSNNTHSYNGSYSQNKNENSAIDFRNGNSRSAQEYRQQLATRMGITTVGTDVNTDMNNTENKPNLKALIRKLELHVGADDDANEDRKKKSDGSNGNTDAKADGGETRKTTSETLQKFKLGSPLMEAEQSRKANDTPKTTETREGKGFGIEEKSNNSSSVENGNGSLEASPPLTFMKSPDDEKEGKGKGLDGKPSNCPTCGKIFASKKDVIQHLRSNVTCFLQGFQSGSSSSSK
mmetsp:Transcript_14394/g.35094  ORF Transcript_14394/g.35094 Transcript_14394/m.35094 type:complete len:439 (-) Transcript_14394:174-1490(-)